MSDDSPIIDVITTINTPLTYVLIAVLGAAGLYLSIRTGIVQLRLLPEMFRVIGESAGRDSAGEKQISSFRAFCVSAASRVGTGNIAGIALAISVGGPGAVFWMWLLALIGSATAFTESTLSQLYKVKDQAAYRGGPAYYMKLGLRKPWMGAFFAVIIAITYGLVFNSVQSNSIVDATSTSFGAQGEAGREMMAIVIGIGLALLVGVIILGGVHRISMLSSIIVPVMAVLYLILGIIVVFMNLDAVPRMFELIVFNAFGLRPVMGAGVGLIIMTGIQRGLFSNEAGMGSVPNAAATSSVSHPVKQGLVQSLGVYFDTMIVCTITAFIVLLSNPEYGTAAGASLTQTALSDQLGQWAVHFLTIAIFLFAFSSILGNYYYGETNIQFLTDRRWVLSVYRAIVLIAVFVGAVLALPVVWEAANLFMTIMALTNLVAVILLGRKAVWLLKDYLRQRKENREPVFNREQLDDQRGIEAWDGADEVTRPEFWDDQAQAKQKNR